jgi:hypothetical protein
VKFDNNRKFNGGGGDNDIHHPASNLLSSYCFLSKNETTGMQTQAPHTI